MLLSLFGGSDMALGDGLVMSLLGISIVFLVLAFLMLFIGVMSRAITGAKAAPKKAEAPAAPAAPAAAPVAAPELAKGSCGTVKTFGVDDRTAAMLMAIVADKMQKPLNEIRFISMHEIQE